MSEQIVLRHRSDPQREPVAVRMPSALPLLGDQVRYQLGLLLRTPRALSTGLVLPVLLLLLSDAPHGQLPAAHVAGLATFAVTMTAWTTHGIGLVAAREAGVLKRWRATPLPPWCYFAGRIAATVLIAAAAGAVTVAAAMLVFGSAIGVAAALRFLLVVALGGLTCAAVCTAVTGFVPNVASAFPVLGLTYLPVTLISGVFGPSTAVPAWVTTLTGYLPIRPIAESATAALAGGGVRPADLAVLATWAVAGVLAALLTFRWAPTTPRQKRAARPS
jgi:ABC-2 type transport system permease protein